MEKIVTRTFDTIARAIYSLGIVTFFILFVTCSMIFFSHGLFFNVVPSHMEHWQKSTATWLLALGWESAVLMTTCNPKHVSKTIATLVSFSSGLIVLFFFEAFDFAQPTIVIVQRWFLGLLAGTINTVYARIFHRRYTESAAADSLPARLVQRDADVAARDAALTEVRAALAERDAALHEVRSTLNDRDRSLKQMQAKIDEYQKDSTCPYCHELQDNPRSLNAHKGHCAKNPKNISE